jgi:hypothetical protein
VGQADTTDGKMFQPDGWVETPIREHGLQGTSEPPSEPGCKPPSKLHSEPGTSPSIYITVIT